MTSPSLTCGSARILLALDKERREKAFWISSETKESDIMRSGIASDMVRLSKMTVNKLSDEEICPFPLHAAYHTAIAYLETSTERRSDESHQALSELQALFSKCSQRWELGGEFFKTPP